jgi:tyrosinase
MIRRNILTDNQARLDFIEGVHRLKLAPWTNDGLSVYDFFVFWHHRAMMLLTPNPPLPAGSRRNGAHWGPAFLPWHRYMLVQLEFQLRQALNNDSFRIPYWDWAADAAQPLLSPLWSAQVMGGTGSPVGSGPFQRFGAGGRQWEIRLAENPNTGVLERVSRGLRRALGAGGAVPGRNQVRTTVQNFPTYDALTWDQTAAGSFRLALEGPLHGPIHNWIGRDMATSTSPNDPVFFLHHANVDRIWRAWQQQNGMQNYLPPANAPAWLAFHRLNDPLHTFFNQQATPAMMLDLDATYQYDSIVL